MQDFINKVLNLHKYLQDEVKDDIGMLAVEHSKEAFQNEAFSKNSPKDEKWQEVKRRQGKGKGAAAIRNILTGETGDLGRSPGYQKTPKGVALISDKEYAQVHNEGGEAGSKKARFTMPQRKFAAPSKVLDKKISNKLEKRFKGFLK
ncbi:phage virion morphogenesis protein [Persicobacter sp. CCB-QB2]|uniref:phage virion morphogenesis protein n=1 Tax=Persicobacter sp. CCB-QB2 TaxID=1561025 RepID=UPI0006A9A1F9|nr:phage virion morphogenesis protein [Persicobacter sp. CCB-QB2]